MELLEAGNEDQAKTELQRALAADPGNRLAQNLLRQISVDPVATLGRESFAYTVKPSETLSRIAGRFLGDIYAFYLLARYNDIKVPRQVTEGQVIRVPGKAPPVQAAVAAPVAPTAPAEPSAGERALRAAEAAERSGDLERAYAEYRRAAELDQADAAGKAERLRSQLVVRFTTNARSAFAKQDLDGSIRQWDRVLSLDPSNETARLERLKAVALKEKVRSLN